MASRQNRPIVLVGNGRTDRSDRDCQSSRKNHRNDGDDGVRIQIQLLVLGSDGGRKVHRRQYRENVRLNDPRQHGKHHDWNGDEQSGNRQKNGNHQLLADDVPKKESDRQGQRVRENSLTISSGSMMGVGSK